MNKAITATQGTGTQDDPKQSWVWTGNEWTKDYDSLRIYKTEKPFQKSLRRALNTGRFDGNNIEILKGTLT